MEQSEKTARFNPSSLNTFRVSTLNINGVVSVCSVIFRCGRGHVDVDNVGAGGFAVGVDSNGYFMEYAYDNRYRKHYETETGVSFKGYHVDEVVDIIELAKKAHEKYLPVCGFAGWDFAIDKMGLPVLIEVNLEFPGIQMEQLCIAKPIFGERTDEVIEWVKRHPPVF